MAKNCLEALEEAHLQWVGNYSADRFNTLIKRFVECLNETFDSFHIELETLTVVCGKFMIIMRSNLVPMTITYYEDGEVIIISSTNPKNDNSSDMFDGDWAQYEEWLLTGYNNSLQLL